MGGREFARYAGEGFLMGRYTPWRDPLWDSRPHVCVYCRCRLRRRVGLPDYATVEHLRAVRHGGESSDGNLALACRRCNELKASHSLLVLERRLADAERLGRPGAQRLRRIVEELRRMEGNGHD